MLPGGTEQGSKSLREAGDRARALFGPERRTLGQREVPGQEERTPSCGAESRRLTRAGDDDLELLEGRKKGSFSPCPLGAAFTPSFPYLAAYLRLPILLSSDDFAFAALSSGMESNSLCPNVVLSGR